MNIDPNMPTLTLGLSEWRPPPQGGDRRVRHWIEGDRIIGTAASVGAADMYCRLPFVHEAWKSCDGVEDGMSKADAMLREWIEGVLQ